MLRISIQEDSSGIRFKLEGRLAQEWVTEASLEWNKVVANTGTKNTVVDLCGVLYVDEAGRTLLTQIVAAGARLEGSGPMTNNLIEEVVEAASASVGHGKGLPRFISVIFLAALAGSGFFGYQAASKAWRAMQVGQAVHQEQSTRSHEQQPKVISVR